MHTSTKITLIQCIANFEAYLTKELVTDPHGLINGGSTRSIKSVKQSMVPGKEDRLTFIEGSRTVKEIYYDEVTKSMQENTLCVIPLTTAVSITDMTVFEEYISVFIP